MVSAKPCDPVTLRANSLVDCFNPSHTAHRCYPARRQTSDSQFDWTTGHNPASQTDQPAATFRFAPRRSGGTKGDPQSGSSSSPHATFVATSELSWWTCCQTETAAAGRGERTRSTRHEKQGSVRRHKNELSKMDRTK